MESSRKAAKTQLERIVLGVDPGTATTGYGVVTERADGEFEMLACGVVRTAAGDPMHLRLQELFLSLIHI